MRSRQPEQFYSLLPTPHSLLPSLRKQHDALSRSRPVQDQLRRRPGDLPARAGSLVRGSAAARRLHHPDGVPGPVLVRRHPDPVPDLLHGRAGPQHPGRLLRPDLARHRRLHGGRRLRQLQAHHRVLPRPRDDLHLPAVGSRGGGRRRAVRAAKPAHQGLLSGGRHARRPVLSDVALQQGAVVLQLQLQRHDRVPRRARCSARSWSREGYWSA